jgi:orotate phosphoribosyltransferase
MDGPDSRPDRQNLARAIAGLSLLRGSFTLRSGKTSSYYLDKYRFSTVPQVLGPVADLFADHLQPLGLSDGTLKRLAGAELGGIPLVTAVGLKTGLPSLFVRNAKKDYGTAKQLEGTIEPGERVVFLEDVATTGGQALEAVAVLRAAGAEVIAVIAVIDRQEGARANIEKAGLIFDALFTTSDLGVTNP